MLGFDDLERLGDLASQMSGNRTRLANSEEAAINREIAALRESFDCWPGSFRKAPILHRPSLL